MEALKFISPAFGCKGELIDDVENGVAITRDKWEFGEAVAISVGEADAIRMRDWLNVKYPSEISVQQSAPERVSVPRELLERIATHLEWDGDESQTVIQYANKCDALAAELRALLNGGEA